MRCADGSLYAGITTDLHRRFHEHEHAAKGAKYLRGRKPLSLVFSIPVGNRSLASRLEHRVKRLGKTDKERLVTGEIPISALVEELAADDQTPKRPVGRTD